MNSSKYLYAVVPECATGGWFGMVEALLLHIGIQSAWVTSPESRIYRILEIDAISAGIEALCGCPLVSDPRLITHGGVPLDQAVWTPVRRAFAPCEKTPETEEVFGPWSVRVEDKSGENTEFFQDLPAQDALDLYGGRVEECIYPEGVTHWQPRRTEGPTWVVTLNGPAGPIP